MVARRSTKKSSADAIPELLAERAKLTQWIERLDGQGDKTPADVRDKVRADYGSRLDKVGVRLRGFSGELTSTLADHKAKHRELFDKSRAAAEKLAEAELRHSVGEYTDDQWTNLRTEIEDEVEAMRADMDKSAEEITRLEEVLSAIADAAATLPDETAEDEDEDEDEEDEEEEKVKSAPEEEEASPPPAAKSPSAEDKAKAKKNFDEMEFLKSLGDSKATKKTPRRTGASFKPAQTADTPRAPKQRKSTTHPTAKKTLKCSECQAMNLPTEWYCEKCGAELEGN